MKKELINKIHHIDCLELMRKLPDNCIDMMITSPPYADRRKSTYGGISQDKYNMWFIEIAKEVKRILKPKGSFFLNIKAHAENGERTLYVMELVILLKKEVGFNFIDELCWVKNGFPGDLRGRFKNAYEPIYHFSKSRASEIIFIPNSCSTPMKVASLKRAKRKHCVSTKNGSGMGGAAASSTMKKIKNARPSNVIQINNILNQYSDNVWHPAVYPVRLVDFFIRSFTHKGDIVMDPFMGSGTTAVSAKKLQRNFIGSELKKDYIDLSNKRLENTQGELF